MINEAEELRLNCHKLMLNEVNSAMKCQGLVLSCYLSNRDNVKVRPKGNRIFGYKRLQRAMSFTQLRN